MHKYTLQIIQTWINLLALHTGITEKKEFFVILKKHVYLYILVEC